jgi:hypothetical protein
MRCLGCALIFAVLGFAAPSYAATTWTADCDNFVIKSGATTVVSGLTRATTLGTLLGTPNGPATISPAPASGDTIMISGQCTEDVTVRTSFLTLTNHNNSGSLNTSDGVMDHQLELRGAAGTVIDGILIGDASAPFAFSGSESANLYVHNNASVQLRNAQVSNGPLVGIFVERASGAQILNTTVTGNGSLAPDGNSSMGILAANNATVRLGNTDGSNPVTVEQNSGPGALARESSSLSIYAAAIDHNALAQVSLLGASSGFISGHGTGTTTIIAPTGGCCQAISAIAASTLHVESGAVVTGNADFAAIGLDASTLVLQGSTVASGAGAASPGKSEPTIHATGNSVIGLAGGNTVCFGTVAGSSCTVLSGGIVLGVDHVSTLIQLDGSAFGLGSHVDTIGGGGSVQLQSTADLGQGLISGSPSVAWVTGSRGISVAQNSSFRLQGGVNITGSLFLVQASNAFFNFSKGGTNTVSGQVLCLFVTVPAAHVALPDHVSPSPTVSGDMTSVSANQCLGF